MFNEEQEQALDLRRSFGIDLYSPIEDMFDLLKKQNITIIKKKITTSQISGLCSKHENNVEAIMINTTYSLGRQYFTLAHELYHLKFDENMSKYEYEKEQMANLFASYFIVPESALNQQLYHRGIKKKNEVKLDDVLYLCDYFKMSYTAMLVRLYKVEKLIDKKYFDELNRVEIQSHAYKNGYSLALYNPTNEEFDVYSDYVELVNRAYNNEKISSGKYEQYLLEGGFEDIVFGNTTGGGAAYDGKIEDYI